MGHQKAKEWGRFRTARTERGPRARTAPIITLFIPGAPENDPPTGACTIHSKQHQGCTIQDPGTRGKHQTKTKYLVYQQGL